MKSKERSSMMTPSAPDLETLRARFFPFVTTTGFTVRPVLEAELRAFVKENHASVFSSHGSRGFFTLPEERVPQALGLRELYNRCHHEFCLFFGPEGKAVGWNMSEAEDWNTFYLRNTGILPEFQATRIYTEFTYRFEEYLATLGYERLTSHHQATNRQILIHKLKHGYCVAGFELTERWGALVKMVKLLKLDRNETFHKLFGSKEHLDSERKFGCFKP